MALTNRDSLKLALGVSLTDTSQDELLAQLVQVASEVISAYCKRTFESTTYTEYYDGTGTPYLILRQRPVTSVTSIYLDPTGYYGDGTNAFGSSTLLTVGSDYVLRKESGTSESKSGMVVRLAGGTVSSTPLSDWPWEGRRGTLTARMPTVWSSGIGNIKITYVAGYASIPADLQHAANMLGAWIKRNSETGGDGIIKEQLGRYAYELGSAAMGSAPELGTARQTLARYRETAI